MAPSHGDDRNQGSWEPMPWYGDGNGWTVVSRKSRSKGKSKVWSDAERTDWNEKRESHTNPKKTLDTLVKSLGEPGKAHRTFLEVMLADGATQTKSKPAPAKKTSNAAKGKADVGDGAYHTGTSLGKGS